MQTKVSTKGQVVLPGSLRRRLDIRPGDALDIEISEGRIVLMPQPKRAHRVKLVTDPVTGLPALSAGPSAPPLSSKEVEDQVLEDDPGQPRFIQTVSGKGYHFIGRFANEAHAGAQESGTVEQKEQETLEEEQIPPLQVPGRIKDRWGVPAATLVIFAFLGAGYLYFRHASRKHALTETDTIVLADFTNTTGDPVFDGTLRQGLTVQLGQSPFLSLVSEDRIQQVLRLMGKPADTLLTPEIAREICERTASAAALDGSIATLGSQYVLGLRAKDCRTGEVLAEEQAQAARREDVLNALSQAAGKLRTRLGESLTTVKQHNTPLAEATTPSLEALKSYSEGWQTSFLTGSAASVPFFQRAIQIDPDFASAYASLGRMYGDIGEFVLSAQNIAEAYELRDRTSDQEKFFISVNYDLQVTGNLEKVQETSTLWMQAYPRAWMPHSLLAGGVYSQLGQYEKAAEEARIAIEGDPDFSIGYSLLATSYLALGRAPEAERTLQEASEHKLDIPDFRVQRFVIAFLKGDSAGMGREATQSREKPGVDDWISNAEGFASAYTGRLEAAREMSRGAADWARNAGRRDAEALYETDAAGAGVRAKPCSELPSSPP